MFQTEVNFICEGEKALFHALTCCFVVEIENSARPSVIADDATNYGDV